MHLISIRNLRLDAGKYPDAIASINSWYATVKKSQWRNLEDVRRIYSNAEAVGSFTVFNIKGNKHRLIVGIDYENHPRQFLYAKRYPVGQRGEPAQRTVSQTIYYSHPTR